MAWDQFRLGSSSRAVPASRTFASTAAATSARRISCVHSAGGPPCQSYSLTRSRAPSACCCYVWSEVDRNGKRWAVSPRWRGTSGRLPSASTAAEASPQASACLRRSIRWPRSSPRLCSCWLSRRAALYRSAQSPPGYLPSLSWSCVAPPRASWPLSVSASQRSSGVMRRTSSACARAPRVGSRYAAKPLRRSQLVSPCITDARRGPDGHAALADLLSQVAHPFGDLRAVRDDQQSDHYAGTGVRSSTQPNERSTARFQLR